MRLLYLLAVYLAAPLISVLLLWRGLWDRAYWHNFGERFGFGPSAAAGGVWVHAVSVGEVQACAALVSALRRAHPELPLTITTFTPTGAARARALFGNLAQVRYVPFDLPGAVKPLLPARAAAAGGDLRDRAVAEPVSRLRPAAHTAGAGERAHLGALARPLPALGRLFSDTLGQVAVVAAQGSVDAERFRSLGADAGTPPTSPAT